MYYTAGRPYLEPYYAMLTSISLSETLGSSRWWINHIIFARTKTR